MHFLNTAKMSAADLERALTDRPKQRLEQVELVVREILSAIRERGGEAVLEYTRKLDWPEATLNGLEIDLKAPAGDLTSIRPLLAESAKNIQSFHQAEFAQIKSWKQPFGEGKILGQIVRPVKRAGIYVPGGKAAYPSTALMASIPAIVAGVSEVVFCTPAGKDGNISPVILDAIRFVADFAPHVKTRAFKLGGAMAIGALAYGAASTPKVDVIGGPGNDYVNIAKRIVYGDAGIDMLAGPSDVAIIADDGANPEYIAADLLAQTEHGPENRGVFLSPGESMIERTAKALEKQRESLKRKSILQLSAENLFFVKTRDLDEAARLSNIVAPEHLEIQIRDPESILDKIENAGAILLGDHTGAPIGDYIAGPSHTLPTGGAARFSSPLSVQTFLKRSSLIRYDRSAAASASKTVSDFAGAEGFDAHARAAEIRTEI